MKNQMHKNKGFSLIELLIAMAILSIVLIMVVQFMSTSSGALSKTKKNLNLQTEAMEIGEQFSDAIAQATYIRVCTQDGRLYELDNDLENVGGSSTKKRKKRTAAVKGSVGDNELVVDNYPNYLGLDPDQKIILDTATNRLVKEDGTPHANARSFRILTEKNPSGDLKQLYVKPKYIYLQYQKKVNGSESKAYVIYYFEGNKIYMNRGDLSASSSDDGYAAAVGSAKGSLLTESMSIDAGLPDCYFSANTTKNTVMLDILLKDSRYNKYTYNYAETILLRNSNVLTVAPNKMYKKK